MILIILGRAAQFLLALVTVRVATTLLSPAQMGQVALITTTTAFFALFLINPVGMFINRRLHAWQATGVAKHYLIRYVGYLLLVVCIAAFLLMFFQKTGVVDIGLPLAWLVLLICGSLLLNTINQTSIPSLNLLGDSKRFVIYSVATVAMSLICATLLAEMVRPEAQYWMLGLLAGQTILALFGTRALFMHLEKTMLAPVMARVEKRHLHVLFSFAWPVAISAGLGWVQGQGYRYLMNAQLGASQLGLFVAGYGISAGMLAGGESILVTYFQPRLYREMNSKHPDIQAKAWHRYAVVMIPSLLLTVAFIAMLAPELTRILLGKHFQSASKYVAWGALAEAARVLVGVYSLIAHVHMRTRWLILPNLIGAVLAITLCALFIPHFGAAGVGMGLASSGFAIVVMMHVLLARRVGGGISVRPILIAGISAVALWMMTWGGRHLLAGTGLGLIIGVPVLVSMAYFCLQYMFLRKHLKDETG